MRRLGNAVAVGLLCGLVLGGSPAMAAAGRVNVNTATAAELAALPGIGPAKAQAIVDHRAKTPFVSPDDLRKVKGIGEKLYESIREQMSVGDAPSSAGRDG